MNYYVYYSYENFGRGYIGCRKCKCDPKADVKYLGSFRDKSFKPTEKIILGVFETYAECMAAEIALHNFFSVSTNPHFANLVKQTSTGFTTEGTQRSAETNQKHKEAAKKNKHKYRGGATAIGRKNTPETIAKMREAHLGITHTEETKKKLSVSHTGKKLSAATKQKLSKAVSNREKIPCPECGKLITDYRMGIHMKIHNGGDCGQKV